MKGVPYQVTGKGPPLVLLHGLAGSTIWWRRNVPELARHYSVHLFDLPGFGRMRGQSAAFTLAKSADWLAEVTDQIKVPTAAVVGHSMGGLISALYAARYPSRVDRLVLVAPAISLPRQTVLSNIVPLAIAGIRSTPAFLPTLFWDAVRCGLPTLLRSARELLALNIVQDMQLIGAPTLVIGGERDPLSPPAVCQAVADTISDSELVLLPKAGHVVMFEAAEPFNREVLRFLSGALY